MTLVETRGETLLRISPSSWNPEKMHSPQGSTAIPTRMPVSAVSALRQWASLVAFLLATSTSALGVPLEYARIERFHSAKRTTLATETRYPPALAS
eukprot:scaffold180692_cov28-Attheya_sp.AAC.1